MTRLLLVAALVLTFGVAPSLAGDARSTGTPPSNTAAPTISGTTMAGSALTATSGSWSGDTPMTYTFVWERCDSSGGNCANIAGATASTYTLTLADVGSTLIVAVTAHNSTGAATEVSAKTAVVTGATPPADSALPSISGSSTLTSTLTASSGTWSGTSPISYTYQWERCDSVGGGCANIAGATALTYVVASADLGHTLRVAVNATNAGGGAQAISAATAVVAMGAPINTVRPVVTGTAKQGQTLTATAGTWTGAGTITYALQWWRCAADATNCSTIPNATSATYVLTAADVGLALKMRVTATNSVGGTVGVSDLTVAVAAGATTTTTTTTPSGTVKLPNGETSIAAASVLAADHLAIASVAFTPTVSHKHVTVTATFKVINTAKYDVSGAIVSVAASHRTFAKTPATAATTAEGMVSITITPTAKAPKSGRLTLIVTARTPAGASARRLVSFRLRP
ncbi:MAG TPA: hypothetical protein VIE38_11940 [Gaiellaceae bacterium]|jgi:hypothetical protein